MSRKLSQTITKCPKCGKDLEWDDVAGQPWRVQGGCSRCYPNGPIIEIDKKNMPKPEKEPEDA